jgi:hypothetical protein
MPIYELINASDPYTFEAPSLEVAGVVAYYLSASYGAQQVDPSSDDRTPVIFGWNEWFAARNVGPEFVSENLAVIVAAYESFVIGSLPARREHEFTLRLITEESKRIAYRTERHDRMRSSAHDIGRKALVLSAHLKEKAAARLAAAQALKAEQTEMFADSEV